MLRDFIEKLLAQGNLSQEESRSAMEKMLADANPLQTAACLLLLRMKGETADELLGAIEAMQALSVSVESDFPVLDIVGTGGDGAHTVNISTGAAIVAASCGVKIAKHGNRSVSSLCGSADVLEALGIELMQTPEEISRSIAEIGIGFMFAPHFHPAMKNIKSLRSGLAVRTLFNIVGPLINPANAHHLMVGVFQRELLDTVAAILQRQKRGRSLVFHGGGLDELSCIGPAEVLEVTLSGIHERVLDPIAFGLPRCTLSDLRGGDAKTNAEILMRVFSGENGPVSDTIAFNAAVALYITEKAPSIETGLEIVQKSLREGAALRLIDAWRSYGK